MDEALANLTAARKELTSAIANMNGSYVNYDKVMADYVQQIKLIDELIVKIASNKETN